MNRQSKVNSDEQAGLAFTEAFIAFHKAVGRYPNPDAEGWEGYLGEILALMRKAKADYEATKENV
jgi:hypothetical protein